MRVDKYLQDNGHVSLEIEETEITVGKRYFMKIIYTAGPEGLNEGGSLRFCLPGLNLNDYIKPPVNCSNPDIKMLCTNRLPEINGKNGAEFFTIDYLFVTLEQGSLKPGDTVTVRYGDNLAAKGIYAPLMAQSWRAEVATDLTGRREAPGSGFYLVGDSPVLNFIGDKVSKLEVAIPAATTAGKPFKITVRAKDRYENAASGYTGSIKLYKNKLDEASPMGSFCFSPDDNSVHIVNGYFFDETGINRLLVLDEGNGLLARSNPSRTTAGDASLSLYWGDTHCHSRISADETASGITSPRPDGIYQYAKKVSALDFCAVTDHTEDLNDEDWRELQKASADNNETGSFAAFSAFEASHFPLRRSGDKNVYFMGDDAAYINSGTLEDLYIHLKQYGDKAMVIPHMHMATDMAAVDTDLVKVAEIYSHWGCSLSPDSGLPMISPVRQRLKEENYVCHALENGLKIGFIASADHSFGHPGDDFWWSLSNYNGGLAGVYAPSLSREELWKAISKRHCYATTRARIILEFEINGAIMGDEISLPGGEACNIRAGVYGTAALKKVEVIKNNGVVFAACPEDLHNKLDVGFSWIDRSKEREVDYYYLHVEQEDGEQAWSSPIWVAKG